MQKGVFLTKVGDKVHCASFALKLLEIVYAKLVM